MLLFLQRRVYALTTNKHVVPLMCGFIFVLGCLLHYERGYFYNSPNFFHVAGADDAYISYRYGWNIAHYGILAWNESGFRQVEGFTNPLWVFLSAAWSLTHNLDVVYPGVTITSVILTAIILILLAYRIASNTSRPFALMGILLLCASPVLWSHTTSGLESGLFGALIGLIAYISIFDKDEQRYWIEGCVLIIVLLRSDGFTYMLVLLCALITIQSSRWKHIAAGMALGLIILFLWRFLTFGSWTPNTAVAKLNFPWMERILPGMQFLLISLPGVLPLIVLGMQSLRCIKRQQQIASGLVIAGWGTYYVYIGGDTYLERHLIGIMVLLACISCYHFDQVHMETKKAFAILALLVAFMFLPMIIGDSRFEYWKPKHQDPWITLGKEIAKDRERYGVIVISASGKIPFFAGGDFVDELGLNDPDLATIKRESFIPGHAAGSRDAAVEIAQSRQAIFTICTFGKELLPEDGKRVLLWIDNINSNQEPRHSISNDEVLTIMRSHPLGYTILLRGLNP